MAIDSRLSALAELQKQGALREWVKPGGGDGEIYLHHALIEAVVTEPIIERIIDGKPIFDTESFRRKALAKASSRGRA